MGAEREHAEGPRSGDLLVAASVVLDVDVPAVASVVGAGIRADYIGVGGGGYCRQGEDEGLEELHGEEDVEGGVFEWVGLIV